MFLWESWGNVFARWAIYLGHLAARCNKKHEQTSTLKSPFNLLCLVFWGEHHKYFPFNFSGRVAETGPNHWYPFGWHLWFWLIQKPTPDRVANRNGHHNLINHCKCNISINQPISNDYLCRFKSISSLLQVLYKSIPKIVQMLRSIGPGIISTSCM